MFSSGTTTRTGKRTASVIAGLVACGLVGACAPSARDQFIASQQTTVRAELANEPTAPVMLVRVASDGTQTAHVMADP
ncbi:MAG: hypothetical protein ACREJO_13180 [Phycisphaerales bacterium]